MSVQNLSFEDVIQIISVFFIIMLTLYVLFRNDFDLSEIDNVAIAIFLFAAVYGGVEIYKLTHPKKQEITSEIVCEGKKYSYYSVSNGYIDLGNGKRYAVDSKKCTIR